MHTAILLVTDIYDDESPVDRYIHHFSEQFTNLGYRVLLAYGDKSDSAPDSPVIQEWVLPFLAEPGRTPASPDLLEMAAQAAALAPRLILHHTVCDPTVVRTLGQALPGVPRVWFAHPAGLEALGSRDGSSLGEREVPLPPHWPDFLATLGGFHSVVAEGEEWARVLRSHLPPDSPPVTVLPPSDPPEIIGQAPASPHCVLFVGDMVRDKGLAELIQAMSGTGWEGERSLQAAGPAPDPDYLAHCEQLVLQAREKGEAFRATFHPDPDPACLRRLYVEAAVLAVPSMRPEPVPPEILEAMTHGLPVVASDVGGVDLLVREGETGHRVEPGNVAALAEKLSWLLADEGRRRHMGKAAREFAAWSFGAREHVIALNQVFEGLIYPESAAGFVAPPHQEVEPLNGIIPGIQGRPVRPRAG